MPSALEPTAIQSVLHQSSPFMKHPYTLYIYIFLFIIFVDHGLFALFIINNKISLNIFFVKHFINTVVILHPFGINLSFLVRYDIKSLSRFAVLAVFQPGMHTCGTGLYDATTRIRLSNCFSRLFKSQHPNFMFVSGSYKYSTLKFSSPIISAIQSAVSSVSCIRPRAFLCEVALGLKLLSAFIIEKQGTDLNYIQKNICKHIPYISKEIAF